jgi:hypothetical protein
MTTFNLKFPAIKQSIRRLLTGLTVPQEYICVDSNSLQEPPVVWLSTADSDNALDVTDSHILLGYKPVLIAIAACENHDLLHRMERSSRIVLTFCHGKEELGSLYLWRLRRIDLPGTTTMIFEAEHGDQMLLSSFHRLVNKFRLQWTRHKPGNIGLPGNLYDQVRISYCVPRVISVITLKDDSKLNVFPTDLHGHVNENYYMSSLRKGSKASAQLERIGKLILSDVRASAFADVYRLGPNHMRDLTTISGFSGLTFLPELDAYVPATAVLAKELERIDAFDVGIHRLYLYKVNSTITIETLSSKLAHIHQYYAQWRIDRRIPTAMLFR